ncbi:DUF2306 domain-containing protein [Shimia sp. Alg240-R146]|uniref:DUF2306 domain-containing protein n=1 Tax=Shimia sp. Alg240-R146 TaxID=2993449 RepID=UPI0022E4C07C|nr:DUF2306 domain-containing protein [Shimia sp. Alg240-R146]
MATLTPLIEASFATHVHVVAAVVAICLAPVQIMPRRRGAWHKRLGYCWVLAMGVTAGSSFWITGFEVMGPFSPIHLLSVLTFLGLWSGLRAAWAGDFQGHAAAMRGMAFWALGIAGALTLLPGRIMHRVLLAQVEISVATGLIAALVIALFLMARIRRRDAANKM